MPNPNWDRISWGKCKTLFLVEAYKKGLTPEVAEKEAEIWADMAMRALADLTDEQAMAEIAKKSVNDLF